MTDKNTEENSLGVVTEFVLVLAVLTSITVEILAYPIMRVIRPSLERINRMYAKKRAKMAIKSYEMEEPDIKGSEVADSSEAVYKTVKDKEVEE